MQDKNSLAQKNMIDIGDYQLTRVQEGALITFSGRTRIPANAIIYSSAKGLVVDRDIFAPVRFLGTTQEDCNYLASAEHILIYRHFKPDDTGEMVNANFQGELV